MVRPRLDRRREPHAFRCYDDEWKKVTTLARQRHMKPSELVAFIIRWYFDSDVENLEEIVKTLTKANKAYRKEIKKRDIQKLIDGLFQTV